jgi:hypothetical protein
VKIVADTGPIIGLAKIGRISLLKKLATEVLIPPFVHKELYGKIGLESDQIDLALSDFINVVDLESLELKVDEQPLINLGQGEKQSILLASTLQGDALLLIDDRAGRQAAQSLNISMIGLVGFLLLSKEQGFIDNVGSLLQELRDAGYWLSDEVIAAARKFAEE